jgi:hypothetical protein
LVILPFGACGHSALLRGEVRLRAKENGLASSFPETVKTRRERRGCANWNSLEGKSVAADKAALASLSSLTVAVALVR